MRANDARSRVISAYKICQNRLNLNSYHHKNIGYKHICRYIHKRWFKSSIQTESSAISTKSSAYSRVLITSLLGTICFFVLGNNEIQKRMSNFVNQRLCLDYFELKETYKYYISNDLKRYPQVHPTKRLLAVITDFFVVGCIVGITGFPMIVRIGMILFTAKYYNQQSPGFMIFGLRGIYVENENENNIVGWRARMDYTNYIRLQYAFCPIQFVLYIGCLGSMTVASIVSTLVFGSHIVQFYGTS
eukprot:UN05115